MAASNRGQQCSLHPSFSIWRLAA